jgi:precorrin-8X/cobalt-precorrin-8 methylmutase
VETGVIILTHGSRGKQGIAEVPNVLARVTDGIKALLPPNIEIIGAALQFNRPTLEEAAESLARMGTERIVIIPYFLLPGRHITEDIPELIEKLKKLYPKIKFILTKAPDLEKHFVTGAADKIAEITPELWSELPAPPSSPKAIEQQSMAILEKLLPPLSDISPAELLVIKRIVHASGDPQVALSIRFSPSAIDSGIGAIAKGSPIFTDIQMVATGINRPLSKSFGCPIACAMSKTARQSPVKKPDNTRAAAAIHRLGKKLNGAIVAIGNAPTALLALLELIDVKAIKPALVIGMPVGFVQAKEAKDELTKRDIPYITILGTRGGSAMAVAAVNALLKIAAEKEKI